MNMIIPHFSYRYGELQSTVRTQSHNEEPPHTHIWLSRIPRAYICFTGFFFFCLHKMSNFVIMNRIMCNLRAHYPSHNVYSSLCSPLAAFETFIQNTIKKQSPSFINAIKCSRSGITSFKYLQYVRNWIFFFDIHLHLGKHHHQLSFI